MRLACACSALILSAVAAAAPVTAKVTISDGWFRTSDTGSLDGGVLTVTGRLDDVVKVGGVKVALPALVDTARSVAGVRDAAALAVDASV